MTTTTRVDVLEAKGLIRLASIRPGSSTTWHGLVQDAAYSSLLKQERRELHGRVGAALEALYPERAGELALVLAMHFEQAGDAGRAIEYYVAGAKHALGQYAIQGGIRGVRSGGEPDRRGGAAPAAVELSADEAIGAAAAGSRSTSAGRRRVTASGRRRRSTRSSASSSRRELGDPSLSDASTRSSPSSGF